MNRFLIILFLFACGNLFSQEQIELKSADKLSGRTENGQTIREVSGNVHFVQGNITAYCNSAVQYIDANKVELTGNVRIYQDTLSLFTEKGFYYGNEKMAIGNSGVTLKDPKATLRADNGVYYFDEAKAVFKGDVIIVNPGYRITSQQLTYFRNTEESFCRGNVIVKTDSAVIKADSLDYYRHTGKTFAVSNVSVERDSAVIYSDTLTDFAFEKKSIADGNVRIDDKKSKMKASGRHLENYSEDVYTIIKGDASLTKPESEKDTLFIYSNILEAFRKDKEHYIARDSVNIIRGDFLAKSGLARYYLKYSDDRDFLSLTNSPVVWQKDMQMTADSIYAELENSKVKEVYARKLIMLPDSKNSFLLIKSDTLFTDRYNQMQGNNITIYFENDKLSRIKVDSNSTGIYYTYEDNKANGINFIDGEYITLYFDSTQKVTKVLVQINPVGKYVPETLMNTVERQLPGFLLREDKPYKRQ
ncbi:MAG TPA: OstA-like protein [Ignavibacteria bacterium]|nr:OstA-like protein [Ignavibacteria bacterium]